MCPMKFWLTVIRNVITETCSLILFPAMCLTLVKLYQVSSFRMPEVYRRNSNLRKREMWQGNYKKNINEFHLTAFV